MLIVRSPALARAGTLAETQTSLNDFLFPLLVCDCCQPLPEAVRLESPYLSQIGGMSRRDLFNDALLLQFVGDFSPGPTSLIGRPAFIGASPAKAAI